MQIVLGPLQRRHIYPILFGHIFQPSFESIPDGLHCMNDQITSTTREVSQNHLVLGEHVKQTRNPVLQGVFRLVSRLQRVFRVLARSLAAMVGVLLDKRLKASSTYLCLRTAVLRELHASMQDVAERHGFSHVYRELSSQRPTVRLLYVSKIKTDAVQKDTHLRTAVFLL